MKFLMFSPGVVQRYMAPEDVDGGSDNPTVEPEGADPEDDDPEGDEPDGDEPDEDDDEPEGDEDEDGDEDDGIGGRAQKRIKKLLAERKEATAKYELLQKELEDAKKLSGDDGKAMIRAAEVSGILPGLMTKEEASAFQDLEAYPGVIEHYEEWLEDHERGDEYEAGGKTMTFVEVKRRVRQLKSELEELKDTYDGRRKELKAKVKEIFETGVAAMKAGWKPGEKKSEKKIERTKPDPKGIRPKRDGDGAEGMEVDNEDDLEAYMARSRRKKK